MNEFNKMGEAISTLFPNAVVIGNHERVSQLGGFDVYLRGVGAIQDRDQEGRYYIFRKAQKGRSPDIQELLDELIILSFVYGDSLELETEQ